VTEPVHGIVINLNAYGATVKLESGELASAPTGDVDTHRATYERSLTGRKSLAFQRHDGSRRPMVTLIPQITDEKLDEQIAAYLKSTQEWESDDELPAAERHFLQKKRRAEHFS
jgi:hypothetical protein